MSNFIENQNWRYAAKKYDATRKISTSDLNTLKEAIRLSVSSYGLQPYKVIVVESLQLREQLKSAAYGQTPITDASHLFIFANDVSVDDKSVDEYMQNISETRKISLDSLDGFSKMIKGQVANLSNEAKKNWTSKQTYIALGNLLAAAAELKIDATPMEGFNAASFNEILGLDKLGLNASVIATVGYRHPDDDLQHYKKVRKSQEELFITL